MDSKQFRLHFNAQPWEFIEYTFCVCIYLILHVTIAHQLFGSVPFRMFVYRFPSVEVLARLIFVQTPWQKKKPTKAYSLRSSLAEFNET